MKRISLERKAAILAKLLPPYNQSVAFVAKQEGLIQNKLPTYFKTKAFVKKIRLIKKIINASNMY